MIQVQYFGSICCAGGSGNVIIIVLEYHFLKPCKTIYYGVYFEKLLAFRLLLERHVIFLQQNVNIAGLKTHPVV